MIAKRLSTAQHIASRLLKNDAWPAQRAPERAGRGFPLRRSPSLVLALLAFLAIFVGTTIGGCSSGSTGTGETTSDTGTTASETAPTSGATSTSPPVTLSQYDRELAKTATAQRDLSAYLSEHGAADNDPRYGLVYGLRVRSQAITGRQALANNNLSLADVAIKDIRQTLNLGIGVATGTTAQILAEAKATAAKVGAPSDAPEQAAILFDQIISQLAPLLDEAAATVPTTGTT